MKQRILLEVTFHPEDGDEDPVEWGSFDVHSGSVRIVDWDVPKEVEE